MQKKRCALQKALPHVSSILETSAKTGLGVDDLFFSVVMEIQSWAEKNKDSWLKGLEEKLGRPYRWVQYLGRIVCVLCELWQALPVFPLSFRSASPNATTVIGLADHAYGVTVTSLSPTLRVCVFSAASSDESVYLSRPLETSYDKCACFV